MTEKTAERTPTVEQIRATNRKAIRLIILAVVTTGLLLLAILSLILIPRTPEQVSIISNVMVIVLILCPVILCLFPVYLLLAVTAFYVGKLNSFTGSKLGKLQDATRKAADSVAKYSEMLGRQTIGIRAKAAILNKIINDNESESENNANGVRTDGK